MIDLSNFKKLKRVQIYTITDYLRTINLQDCTNLREVYITGGCDSCIDALNLKGCTNLRAIEGWGGRTGITSMDLSKNKKLETLSCYWTELVSLDLSNNPNLIKVDCHKNPNLTKVNVKGCRKLRTLRLDNTNLEKLNVKTNTNLQVLRCKNTNLEKLNLKRNVNLRKLLCENTRLTELDLSNTRIRESSALECDPDVTVTYAK